MQLGWLLEPGDMLDAGDERLFGVDAIETGPEKGRKYYHPVMSGSPRPTVGVSGGLVSAGHAHFFRPWRKSGEPNPEADEANAQILRLTAQLENAKNALETQRSSNAVMGAQLAEVRKMLQMAMQPAPARLPFPVMTRPAPPPPTEPLRPVQDVASMEGKA